MASANLKLCSLAAFALAIVQITVAGDPDILFDYIAPNNVDGSFFTFTGFRAITEQPPPQSFKATKASAVEFPAVFGQSVSYAALQFPAGSINPPHTHPRSAELLLVAQGALQVGFVDTTNKLLTSTLQTGDMFVFPKGLVHFQHNADNNQTALALSAFGSANAGTVSIPNTLFNSSIDDTVLALAFKTDVGTIQTLKKGFAPK
ncbi:germin-like protein 9-3 [Prosopis cineraria]|uniref:germin-like protein 9-3 n=1 Tax=Prosopis cineraria TaxID=364024 RepID=UPI00240F9288|nr:germin-like protein 9-3 [Prosopis cineraria]